MSRFGSLFGPFIYPFPDTHFGVISRGDFGVQNGVKNRGDSEMHQLCIFGSPDLPAEISGQNPKKGHFRPFWHTSFRRSWRYPVLGPFWPLFWAHIWALFLTLCFTRCCQTCQHLLRASPWISHVWYAQHCTRTGTELGIFRPLFWALL